MRTSEDFSTMINSPFLISYDPACAEMVENFNHFKQKIMLQHDPIWFFNIYKDSPWFILWGENILHKPYFYDIVLKDAAFRAYFLDIMPTDMRAELFFWTNFNVDVRNLWQSQEFLDFISTFSAEDTQAFFDYRAEKLLEYQKSLEFMDYLQNVDNFNKYVGSFPQELNAQVWAFERLNDFERWCSRDAIFFSNFSEHLTSEYRMEFGQSKLLHPSNLKHLSTNELAARLHFANSLEKHGSFLPIELKNLLYNCEEIINLRRHLLRDPAFLAELKDQMPAELFEKICHWKDNFNVSALPTSSPQVCAMPFK